MMGACQTTSYDAEFITQLYHVFFDREPDSSGLQGHLSALRSGLPPHDLVARFLHSNEFATCWRPNLIPPSELPNLRQAYPDHYEGDIYLAFGEDRIALMENLIVKHRYYDYFGVWSSTIDYDKMNMAKLVLSTGAKNCLEVGCFNGPVLSVLRDQGLEVTGVDLSHLAFVLAFPNIRDNLVYGDLFSASLSTKYDCILLLDVMEHLNPLKLGHHINRLRELLNPNGLIILNSPMLGFDPTFGSVSEQNLQQWRDMGDEGFFRHWPCDKKGWPMHGHMIWASPKWWTQQFDEYDLIRRSEIEKSIQTNLSEYFVKAPGRKSLAIFTHRAAAIDDNGICEAISRQSWL